MKCTKLKSILCLILLACSFAYADDMMPDENSANLTEITRSTKKFSDDDCCDNSLNLFKLCAKKVAAKCIDAHKIETNDLCAGKIKADDVCTTKLKADEVCTKKLNTQEKFCALDIRSPKICGLDIRAPKICAHTLFAQDFCATGSTKVNSFEQCGKFRASAVFAADVPYILGTAVNFDTITDDPNGNISLAPFFYEAPLSGYYTVTLQLHILDLHTATGIPILGVPVGNAIITVNGNVVRQNFTPFLTFLKTQNSTYSNLLSLKAGDKVQIQFKILYLDQTLGLQELVGSVDVAGNGTENDSSLFKIHYLSSDCAVPPCEPCDTTCEVTCEPCDPNPCKPCNPCNPCENFNPCNPCLTGTIR